MAAPLSAAASSHSSMLHGCGSDELPAKAPVLMTVPYSPKRRPLRSFSQATALLGAWKGQSPATRMPDREAIQRMPSRRRCFIDVPRRFSLLQPLHLLQPGDRGPREMRKSLPKVVPAKSPLVQNTNERRISWCCSFGARVLRSRADRMRTWLTPGQLGRNLQKVSPPHPLFQHVAEPSAELRFVLPALSADTLHRGS